VKNIIIVVLLLSIIVSIQLYSQESIFEGDAEITLGSDMTLLQAIELAKIQTEKNASEKAGIYIQAESKIENYILVENVVTTFSADIMKKIDFKHDIIIENHQLILKAKGRYLIDLDIFYERLKSFQKNKNLENELARYKQKYNDLLQNLIRAEDYEKRKQLLSEYREITKESKNIFIQDELFLTNRRLKNLKKEFDAKIDEIQQYIMVNSEVQIVDKNIKMNEIIIKIKFKRDLNEKLIEDLEEIIEFGSNKGYTFSDNFFERIDSCSTKSTTYEKNKNDSIIREKCVYVNCYNLNDEIIYSESLPIYHINISPVWITLKGMRLLSTTSIMFRIFGGNLKSQQAEPWKLSSWFTFRFTELGFGGKIGKIDKKILYLALTSVCETEVSFPNDENISTVRLEF